MSLRPSSAPHSTQELIASTGASLWGFARATGLHGEAAEVALRAAFAEAWPPDPPADADRAALLAAMGGATATVKASAPAPAPATGDLPLTHHDATPIAVAFRSLPWATQVSIWGRTVEGLAPDAITAALGPDADMIGDAARQLLPLYLTAMANTAPPQCADALRRAATKVETTPVSVVDDLDPHIAACPSCRSWLPIRVSEQLEAATLGALEVPSRLVEQIAIDHARMVEGLPLTVDPSPRTRTPRGAVALAGAAVIVVGLALLVMRSAPPRPTLGAPAAASTTGVVAAAPAGTSPPGTQSGSVALGAVSATTVTAAPVVDSPTTTGPVLPEPPPIRNAGRGRPGGASRAPTPVPAAPNPSAGTDARAWLLTGGGGGPWVTRSTPGPSTTQPVPLDVAPPSVPPAAPPPFVPPPFVPAPPPTVAPTTTTTTTPPTTGATTTVVPTTTTTTTTTSTTTAPASLPMPLIPLGLVFVPGIGLPIGARHRRRRLSARTAGRHDV